MENKAGSINTIRKKPVNKKRVLFIICCCILPVLHFSVFYLYANASSFIMAFTDRMGAFSFNQFGRFFNEIKMPNSDIRVALKNTLLTFSVLLVTFPLKILVAYFIYKKVPGAAVYRILFFLPQIIFSVALAMIFQRIIGVQGLIAQTVQKIFSLDRTPELLTDSRFANITVILHMVWLQFPGDLIIWGGTFARIPTTVLESGKIDGVSWWTEFSKITLPMVWPTAGLQMVLMFCGIFSASGSVFLLTGGNYGTTTLSVWMYLQLLNSSGNMYSSNVYNYLSAVGLVITTIAIILSLSIRRWTDRAFEEVEF